MWTTKEMPSQKGKPVVVTGANTGIGYKTALALFKSGENIIVACRDKDKAKQAIINMKTEKGTGSLEVGTPDLANLNSVKQFAETFIEKHRQLHLLLNNAGVAIPPASKTREGYKLQFGVNFWDSLHLGLVKK